MLPATDRGGAPPMVYGNSNKGNGKVQWFMESRSTISPLDKVFLYREGQILVEISLLLQSRLRRRLLLCQCAMGLSDGTSQGKQWLSYCLCESLLHSRGC